MKIVTFVLMEKSIKSLFLVFLSGIILFTSTGFGLVEHSCSMRGKKTYSFITKDSCRGCSIHKNTSSNSTKISRTKCCYDKQLRQNNISESLVNITGKLLKAVSQIILNGIIWIATITLNVILSIFQINQNEQISIFGKTLLISIGILRL